MTMNRFFRPIFIGSVILFLIFGLFLFYLRHEIYNIIEFEPSEECTPQDGVWYCDELKMQLSFSKQYHSTVIIDGEELQCAWRNDIGSCDIYVLCQETENQQHALGELLLWIEYVSMGEETYAVRDHNTGETYIFIRLH